MELLDRDMGREVLLVTPAGEAVEGGDRLLGFVTGFMAVRLPRYTAAESTQARSVLEERKRNRRVEEWHER